MEIYPSYNSHINAILGTKTLERNLQNPGIIIRFKSLVTNIVLILKYFAVRKKEQLIMLSKNSQKIISPELLDLFVVVQ